jgi:hypothetical protein
VWFIVTSLEVVLLGLVLALLMGHDQHAFFKDLSIYCSGIILLFFSTGYLLSTGFFRSFGVCRHGWSPVATALFFIHFEIMNVGLGGAFEPSPSFVQMPGCIVFACTLAGTFALRKWASGVPKKGSDP